MDFRLTKEEALFQKMCREFALNEVEPIAAEIDAEERYPEETVQKLMKYGLMGIQFPKEVGGSGGNYICYSIAIEEMSRVCGTTGGIMSAHGTLGAWPIYAFGTPEQKEKWLRPLIEPKEGAKIGAFGLTEPTGIDLPGEAATIMHKKENMGLVELATVSFGQSFQITPIQLATTVSGIINGGNRITPHFGISVESADGTKVRTLEYPVESGIVSGETSRTVRTILETVVSEGSGKNAGIQGFSIGGKTATSQTLPRGSGRYISSFLGFAPAEDPKVLALCIIYAPQGMYYGGIIAAPVVRSIFENVLPYLGIERTVTETSSGENRADGVD